MTCPALPKKDAGALDPVLTNIRSTLIDAINGPEHSVHAANHRVRAGPLIFDGKTCRGGWASSRPKNLVSDTLIPTALRMLNIDAEKAAGVSNAGVATSRSDAGRRGGLSGDDEDRSKDELIGRTRMRDALSRVPDLASRNGDEGTSFREQLQPARAEFALRGPHSALRLDAVHDI